jgi:hypothetical protein
MKFIMSALGAAGGSLLNWALGSVIRSFVEKEIQTHIENLTHAVSAKMGSNISKIEDENLAQAAKYAVRYVATNFPDIKNDEKLQKSIDTFLTLTPPAVDFFISDDAVRGMIEKAYREFKKDLSNL